MGKEQREERAPKLSDDCGQSWAPTRQHAGERQPDGGTTHRDVEHDLNKENQLNKALSVG